MPIPGNVTMTDIPGGSEKEGREGTCDFFSFTHGVHASVDPSTGTATGRRIHQAVSAVIRLDKAFPLLFHALETNKVIDEVKFDFYRINPTSRGEEKYATITLKSARILALFIEKPDTQQTANERKQDMVIVEFSYEEITWEYLPDSIAASARWAEPSAASGADD